MKFLLAIVLACCCCGTAYSEEIFKVAIGSNGVWYNNPGGLPSDFEVGANARASLSPHISAVGSAYWGLDEGYTRGKGGVRVTATDVDNPNFSIGLGAQYQISSDALLRPEEWIYDASLGWRPWPVEMPKVILVAQGSYGQSSQQGSFLAGVRYVLGGF